MLLRNQGLQGFRNWGSVVCLGMVLGYVLLTSPLRISAADAPATRRAKPQADVQTSLDPANPKSGETITLQIRMKLSPGTHTFSTTTPASLPTTIELDDSVGVEVVGSLEADQKPKREFSADFNDDVETLEGDILWTQKLKLVSPEGKTPVIKGNLHYQICRDGFCKAVKEKIEIPIPVRITTATANANLAFANGSGLPTASKSKKKSIAEVKVSLDPPHAKSGEGVSLKFEVKIVKGSYTYSTTSPIAKTTLSLDESTGIELLGDVEADHPPKRSYSADFMEDVEKYTDAVTWTQKLKLTDDPNVTPLIKGRLDYQVCDDRGCRMLKETFEISPLAADSAVVPVNAERPDTKAPSKPEPATKATPVPAANGGQIADIRQQGLFPFISAAFLAGLAALITPCVFPMVPITVSFFLKQSEKEHHRPVTMACVYCGSIILTFVLLGMLVSIFFGAAAINVLANTPWLNLFLAAVLIFFALNLLGMYEIWVPSSVLSFTAGKEALGGYIGVVFMALTFTLTSFTCTFAFLGLILVWAANGTFWWPLLGLTTFATAFALPFFLLALFPSYLAKLPKSGGWMNRVKVVMGLIELAFVFKFLSVADISWNGKPLILDYHMVMSAWMVISLCAGAYLLGWFKLPHDEPSEKIGVLPAIIAMSFLGFGSYLGVGLFGKEPPEGLLWNNIAAFAPPSFKGGNEGNGHFLIGEHDKLKYWLEFDAGLKEAQKENRLLFLDFTGVNCINCRKMEKILAQPHNSERLKQLVRVQLYTDAVPEIADPALTKKILEENRKRQEEWFQDVTLPAYAVVSPDGETLLSKYEGLELNQGEFASFLDEGIAAWKQQAAGVRQTASR
ncbi:MAG: hypothetical protein KDA68_05965 [Planctomycetaceae bacterium]|nr:hypothetical protein [Planctomycetaceae bacterium]